MTRLKLLVELQDLEHNKETFSNMLNDIKSHYFEWAKIELDIKTNDYHKKHVNQDRPKVNKELFKIYLEKEINQIEEEIEKLIKQLK